MVINEIFYSIQGEGLLAGVPSVFIRLAGCPLRCSFCDTKYALDPTAGENLSLPEILDRIETITSTPNNERRTTNDGNCEYVVITGGEPMVNPQLPQLADELKKRGKHISIETAGIAYIPNLACDLMSISPKILSNIEPIRQLIEHYPYQLKFVVDTPEDLPEIQQVVDSLRNIDPTRIMLMPQAKTRNELIAKSPMVAELCKNTGFLFCNRLQILLYNGQRRK
jgi:7-carboxy-7-deazaguanine synthase